MLRALFHAMTWYYVKDGEAAGPVSNEELRSKLRLGSILPTTLVWRSGLTEWQAAGKIAPQIIPPQTLSLAPVMAAPPELGGGPPPVLPHFFCTVCGTIIPADQLVRLGARAVCARCKPTYLQQTREGLDAPVKAPIIGGGWANSLPAGPDSDLADPLNRLVAHLLDLLFIGAPIMVVYVLAFFTGLALVKQATAGPPPVLLMVLVFGFIGGIFFWIFFYWTWFIGRSGATPGMKLLKVKMVRADRTAVGYGRAFGRAILLYVINSFTMGLTNITAFFDREKRTVTDMICDTRVVRN